MPIVDPSPANFDQPLLEVRRLDKRFVSRPIFRRAKSVVAAEQVSFQIDRGEGVALVGESGSGKSTIARLLLRLEAADAGQILLEGVDVRVTESNGASLRYRGRVQMVFQDPFGSLNAVHSVAHHLARPLLRHRRVASADVRRRALDLLETVGLAPAADFIDRHPYELSGGQRQRVAIARALAAEPQLLVADEPTSMLDVSIRMDILNLLRKLKEERRLAILLITHDLAAARYLADRILVLFQGRIVEDGPSRSIVESPAHPYTRALLEAIEGSGTSRAERKVFTAAGSGGCPFASRCGDVMEICRTVDPGPRWSGDRRVRCHLYPDEAGPAGGAPPAPRRSAPAGG